MIARPAPCPRRAGYATVYLGDVAEYEVEAGSAALLVSVANPVAEGLFSEGETVVIALPTHPVALVPAGS